MSLPRKVRPLPFPCRSLGLALCAAALLLAGCEKKEAPKPPPAEVTAVTLVPQTVPVSVQFVAQVESSHQVEILARVNGFLDKILYKEGEMVKAGKVMFQIDPKPFQAAVAAAKGEVENRQAQLWTAKANLDRVKPLAALDAISKSDLDNATGEVQSAEAALYSSKANLDKAQLDLGYTTIHAPVTGVSGEAFFREGTYLNANAGERLSYVAQIDPIWVTFSVSQNQMTQRQQEVATGQLIRPNDLQYQVEIELSDGSRYPYVGKLNFISPTFSQQTGTFLIRAELPNANGVLRPGMFVKANVKGDTRPNALVVPQKAVQQTDNGHVVTLVSPQGTAEIRPVIVGDWVGNDWVIKQGLKAGEQVIVDGFQRLKPGAPVKVVGAAKAAAPAQPAAAIKATAPQPAAAPAAQAQPAAAPQPATPSAAPQTAPTAKPPIPVKSAAPAKSTSVTPSAASTRATVAVKPAIQNRTPQRQVPAVDEETTVAGQLLLGMLAIHGQAAADSYAAALTQLSGQPVRVRLFQDEATLADWFRRFRALDLAVIPTTERGDLLAGDYHLLQQQAATTTGRQVKLVARRDLSKATLQQFERALAAKSLPSVSVTTAPPALAMAAPVGK